MPDMKGFFEGAAVGLEAVGIVLLLVGLSLSLAHFLYRALRVADKSGAYGNFRLQLGRTLLLTLEFLIASDITYTIAVDRSFASLGMLGLLVLIRTFLSFSIEVELTGRWPWRGGDVASGLD
jgi:uncharacterized membrane protein